MKLFRWMKSRIQHKISHLSWKKIVDTAKKDGPSLVAIIFIWEVIEDIAFPLLFGFLGKHIHGIFYLAIPVSWMLCLHWIAVPIMWAIWKKLKGSKDSKKYDSCGHDH